MPFKSLAKMGAKRRVNVPAKKRPMGIFDIVMENIETRRSVRKFKDADVSDADLIRLMEAARNAPSAGNMQPWEFIIVRDPKMKKILVEAAEGQDWIAKVPVMIVACINVKTAGIRYGERGMKLYGIQDVACATENLLLAANALGLGTCWVGKFSEPIVAHPLHCPEFVRPCALIAVGWPAEAPEKPARHAFSEFVHMETYGNTPRAQFAFGQSTGGTG